MKMAAVNRIIELETKEKNLLRSNLIVKPKTLNSFAFYPVQGESVDVVRLFSLFALDVIMRAAFGMENDIQMNPDPVLVEKARNVFQTPLWVRFFSMFPSWGYFSR